VSDGYLATMGIELVAGRDFSSADLAEAPRVILVNERFVRRYWPGMEPVGRTVSHGGTEYTVIGVVRDGHYRTISDQPFPLIYRAFGQSYHASPVLHVRAGGNPASLIPALRSEFLAINPDLPFLDPRTMRQHMQQATIGQEIGSRTLSVFGAISLLLAAVGIYGVMAYTVGQRTREIGVRVALGAATGSIAGLIVRKGLLIALAGAAAGSVAAVGVGRLLEGLLLGVDPLDPLTFGVIVGLLMLVSIVACLVPARRAAGVDPVIALKAE
jgi:predicted permease